MNLQLSAIHRLELLLLTGVMTTSQVLVLGRTGGRTVQRPHDRGVNTRLVSMRGEAPFWQNKASAWDAALHRASVALICGSTDRTFLDVAESIERARSVGEHQIVLPTKDCAENSHPTGVRGIWNPRIESRA